MRELSIFIDESGDFGSYSYHSPYYIITFVFHNQAINITEKKQLVEETDLNVQITKQLSMFLNNNLEMFLQYNRIIVYYDNGQTELTNILVSVFDTILQIADMLCTLELLSLKADRKMLSKSEFAFFISEKDLYKSYLKAIHKKKF